MAADRTLPPLYIPNGSPEKGALLQQYMALNGQQGAIQRRLSTSSQSPPSSPKSSTTSSPEMSASSASSSTTSSPSFGPQSFSQISPPTFALPKPTMRKSRRPSMSPIPEDATIDEIDSNDCHFPMSPDEHKLYDVNHNIKSTLTELLNCDAVRHDHRMRLWVQTRLLDAEKELKKQRKRRVSAPTVTLRPSMEGDRRSSG